tara:strand:+ start:618 stop:767 length:150 start_codon:yes stop_codon:yes gene_type:complete
VLPRSTAIVRQMMAVRFLIEMDLEDFEFEGRGRNVPVSKTHRSFGNLVG